jgi:tetratricopeptide (TPR) repeat protein
MIRSSNKQILFFALLLAILLICERNSPAQQRTKISSAKPSTTKSITVRTEPNAMVWIDGVRRGVTEAQGTLVIKTVAAGRRVMRVRAIGFKESNVTLAPARRGTIAVSLVRTTDQSELLFQQAEAAREKARDDAAQKAAEALYRDAIKLRPKFPEAHLGLARVLLELNDYVAALAEIDAAHVLRRNYAEASAVEGRILRMAADENAAIDAFRRALSEGRGFQPEAHTGLALVYQDQGKYEEAAAAFQKALAQLSDTEPILYQLLGAVYEKLEKYKEAVAVYEKYLELAPDGNLAPAIRSVMDQLRQQAEGRGGLPY